MPAFSANYKILSSLISLKSIDFPQISNDILKVYIYIYTIIMNQVFGYCFKRIIWLQLLGLKLSGIESILSKDSQQSCLSPYHTKIWLL